METITERSKFDFWPFQGGVSVPLLLFVLFLIVLLNVFQLCYMSVNSV